MTKTITLGQLFDMKKAILRCVIIPLIFAIIGAILVAIMVLGFQVERPVVYMVAGFYLGVAFGNISPLGK